MPDIDIDFEDTQRDRVLDYVKQKYGHAQFCHIGTYMKMAAKAAFKDVARVLGVQFDRSNQISNLLPEKLKL
jgi:DNA polymerase-3 subunit alpha